MDENERLESLAHELYEQFYNNPEDSMHYADIQHELRENDLPETTQFMDFLADCIDKGVEDGESGTSRLSQRELIENILQ